MGKFVSPKDDVSFKYLFLNETVRLHFISDVLGIPLEEIRSVRLANPFLWKKHYERLKRCICISILGFNMDEMTSVIQCSDGGGTGYVADKDKKSWNS